MQEQCCNSCSQVTAEKEGAISSPFLRPSAMQMEEIIKKRRIRQHPTPVQENPTKLNMGFVKPYHSLLPLRPRKNFDTQCPCKHDNGRWIDKEKQIALKTQKKLPSRNKQETEAVLSFYLFGAF